MFLSFSLTLSLSSRPLPLPNPDLPLRSLRSLLQRNLYPDPHSDPYLDLVVDAPKAEVPLYLFLPMIRGGLGLNNDLVLASKDYPPIPLPSSSSPLLLSPDRLLSSSANRRILDVNNLPPSRPPHVLPRSSILIIVNRLQTSPFPLPHPPHPLLTCVFSIGSPHPPSDGSLTPSIL